MPFSQSNRVTAIPRELVTPAPLSDFSDIIKYVGDRFSFNDEPSEIYIDGEPAELNFN